MTNEPCSYLSNCIEYSNPITKIYYVLERNFEPGECRVRQRRNNNGIFYIVKGELEIYLNNVKHTVSENSLVCFNIGDEYTIVNNTDEKTVYYLIAFDFLNSQAFRNDFVPFCINVNGDKKLEMLFKDILDVYNSKTIGHMMKMYSIMNNIIYRLLRNLVNDSDQIEKYSEMADVIKYIHLNYNQRISIDELIKNSFSSPTHFRRIFKNNFGISPLKYLNNVRIEKAKELLAFEQCSVSECCERVGFTDIAHFSVAFKKAVGCTPLDYRTYHKYE